MFVQPTPDDLAELMKRFADAGWIRGSIQVRGRGQVAFTRKGAQRLIALTKSLDELAELGVLTTGQFSALTALACKFCEEHGPDIK